MHLVWHLNCSRAAFHNESTLSTWNVTDEVEVMAHQYYETINAAVGKSSNMHCEKRVREAYVAEAGLGIE